MIEVMATMLRGLGYFALGSIPVSIVFFLAWVLPLREFLLTMSFIILSDLLGVMFWALKGSS